MKKKTRTFIALCMALILAASSGMNVRRDVTPVKAKAVVDNMKSEESIQAFKVTMDDTGYITADSADSLENQKFSWDNATVYFVLTDRFKNGDTSNDHSYGRGLQADGRTPVEGLDSANNPGTFHGGDLKGMTEVVEDGYFNELGVNAIWITAPYEQIHGYTSGNKKSNNANTYPDPEKGGFPYYSYHGYWTLDYSNIDENMGSEEDFEKFCDACHEHGIRVVMDVVMNHVGYVTMQDAVDYGFEGALKGDWQTYYYGNSTYLMGGDPESETYWDKTASVWSKWWGPAFVKADYPGYTAAGGGDIEMSLCGLPDVMTSKSAAEGDTPPLLVNKWTKEGRLSKEQGELDDYFSRTGNKKQARYYIIKWLSDWVREYGVDGFRCDTAKHVDMDAWKDLKEECVSALKEWRKNNPNKPGAKWTDDFWMTGEAWGHGMGRSPYYDNGFDSMINFTFPKGGSPSTMEGTYSSYAEAINSDPTFNSLSYISSHDDCLTRGNMIDAGTDLLLTPGAAQIYYGDESNRPIGWESWFSSDYTDQRYRTDMNWDSMDQKVLSHWQKVGQFRNNHISVGAGQHEMLESEPYTFSRTYNLEEEDEDKVVCCLPGKAGTYDVNVGDVFEDGETVTDAYTGEKAEVSGGTATFTCDANGVILVQGSGIVKASVNAKTKNKATTYSSDTFDITLRANKAKDTYYSINGGEKVAFNPDDVLTIGGDTAYEEKTEITLYGISEDDGSELEKKFTYQRGKEPTVSDGEFAIKVKKSDFSSAPTVFAYSNDKNETAFTGKWPGDAFVEDDDADYYIYKNDKITDEARIILVSGTWRSTPEMAPGLLAKGSMLYDKTSNELSEVPSGEPGKVIIKYVDQNGEELKSIYRVGVVGKKYKTYPAVIDGYTLAETPDNADGEFETESEVTYVYTNGSANVTPKPIKTISPTPSDKDDKKTPAPTDDIGTNVTAKPIPTEEVKETKKPIQETQKPIKETQKPSPTKEPTPTQGNSSGGKDDKPTKTIVPTKTPTSTTKPTNVPTKTNVPVKTPEPTGFDEMETMNIVTDTSTYYVNRSIKFYNVLNSFISDCKYVTKIKDKNGKVLKTFNKVNFSWTPTKTGTYTIETEITNGNGEIEGYTKKTIKVVYQPLSLSSFIIKKSGNKKAKITVKSAGGKGTVKYKFSVKAPGTKKKVVRNFSNTKSIMINTKKKGIYTVYLEVKDSSGIHILITKKYKKS
ncbi:MAG: MucBP domain-containing protein [Lachnospiraceae bacterium]|nr:MucBP domain-containing protein [Lachnospiraceae bacterium]